MWGRETPTFGPQQHPTLTHTSSSVETVSVKFLSSVYGVSLFASCLRRGYVQLTHIFTPTHRSHNTQRALKHPSLRHIRISVHPNRSLFQLPSSGNLTRSDHLNGLPFLYRCTPLYTHSLQPAPTCCDSAHTRTDRSLASFIPPWTYSTCLVFRSSHSGFAWVNARVCLARIPEARVQWE